MGCRMGIQGPKGSGGRKKRNFGACDRMSGLRDVENCGECTRVQLNGWV
jgi:hypothetical protein